jgi:hypothetical protein
MTRMRIPTSTSGIRFYEPKNMGMMTIDDMVLIPSHEFGYCQVLVDSRKSLSL